MPSNRVLNDDLVARGVDTNDEWIVARTGIKARHLAEAGQTSSDLGLLAFAARAIEMAGISADQLDLIIVATSTPDFVFPSTACLLQGKLGNKGATAFDVQAVCSGLSTRLRSRRNSSSPARTSGHWSSAPSLFAYLDLNDRGTCVLFGDGAGAVVLRQPENRASWRRRCMPTAHITASCRCRATSRGKVTGDPFLRMDGRRCSSSPCACLPTWRTNATKQARLAPADIDWLIPHQANIRIIEATAK